MGEVCVKIAGRAFTINYEEGQAEAFKKASALFSDEVEHINKSSGNMRNDQLFLFAGLILADKYIAQTKEINKLRKEPDEALQNGQEKKSSSLPDSVLAPISPAVVEVVPEHIKTTMTHFAEQLEMLVIRIEEKLS